MTKDELIERLQNDLQNVMGWAAELNSEYLDGDPDTRKAFVADMESARESSLCQLARGQEWVDVNERLPEHNLTVIGSIDNQVLPVYYHYPVESWYAGMDEDMKYPLNISYWMPLPEPPTKPYD